MTRIKVIDIELSSPFPPLNGLGDYEGLQVLVRLHGRPVGYIARPVIGGSCPAPDLKKAILEELSEPILRHLLFDRLAEPLGADRICIEELIKAAPPGKNHLSLPLVTVAVCTRDRSSYLPTCLDALNRLDYPRLDLLVVDNAPKNDTTERLVRSTYPNLRYFREPRPGLDWARNRAIIEARGEIIAYTDDDCVVDPGWVNALADKFIEEPEIMAITGLVAPYELETEAQILFEKRFGFGRGFERRWYPANTRNGRQLAKLYFSTGQFGTGANMAFRRAFLNQINYFDPGLDYGSATRGGGDLEMFFRVLSEGGGLLYEPKAIVRHRHRRTYAKLKIQIRNWAIGFGAYIIKCSLTCPDARAVFLRKGLWWLWMSSIRRPLGAFKDPNRLPWDLLFAQASGSLMSPMAFLIAFFATANIIKRHGPLRQSPIAAAPGCAKRRQKYGVKIGVFTVDLNQPLPVLPNAAAYSVARILVNWNGRQLGSFEISNCYKSITRNRLREAVVNHLGVRLLDPDCKKSLDELRVESYSAIARHISSV